MNQLGEFLFGAQKPFVISGDVNSLPSEAQRLRSVQKMRGAAVSCNRPTCRVGKVWRELDFFVVSHELVGVVRSCE
eukprot:3515842-Pyramimonas_sp.AAC.1